MFVLSPKTITAAMIGAGTTIAEPAAGETAWVSGATHVVGDKRIRATTHREYQCKAGHTGITTYPENDATNWDDIGPTQRHAPFDIYTTTAASTVTTVTYVLNPGYFNAISLYGLTGTDIAVTIKDTPAGATIYSYAQSLLAIPSGWYGYLFVPRRATTKLVLSDLPIRPGAELTITITAATSAAVGVGMINVGDLRPLVSGSAEWGGSEYGATASPITYSYIKTNFDGTMEIVRRHKATNMRVTVMMPRDVADAAVEAMQDVLDTPVSWIGINLAGYDSLNVFGLGSGSLSFDNFTSARFDINVKGFI